MTAHTQKGNKMQININLEPLKRAWNENPLAVLGTGAAVVAAAAKLYDSAGAAKNRRTYAKEIDRRVKQSRLK